MQETSLETILQSTPYPWQLGHWDRLTHAIQQEKLPHALLLAGQMGMGQDHFAKALATLLLCEQKNKKACGVCTSCQLMEAQTHPDFFSIQPEEDSSVIKIDQIRQLLMSLSQRALKGQYKVVLIQPLEALNIAASNALLKQLEEPFSHTIFLLISYDTSRLLPSIISRCQRLRFYTDLTPELKEWLKEKIKTTQPVQDFWPSHAAPFQLIKALNEGVVKQQQEFLTQLLTLKTKTALAEYCETISQQDLLSWMMTLVGDCIRLHYGQKTYFPNLSSKQLFQSLALQMNIQDCYRVLQYYTLRQEDLDQQVHLNASLFVLSLIIPWTQLCVHQALEFSLEAL